jgi:hypothetical protein
MLNSIAGATLQITAVPFALWATSNPDVRDVLGTSSTAGHGGEAGGCAAACAAVYAAVCAAVGRCCSAVRCGGAGKSQRRCSGFVGIAAYGAVFTAVVFMSACYQIGTTRYTPVGNESFWCDLAGG